MSEKKEFLLHDEQLEVTVIGSLVWSCSEGNFDAFYDARLSPDLFYYDVNKTIFGVIVELINSSIVPDPITIMERVNTMGIKNIEAADVVVRTEWHPGQEVNFYKHVMILRELALRRKAQKMSHMLANGSTDPTICIDDVLKNIEELKADADAMELGIFSPYFKGAQKEEIRERLLLRGQRLSTGYHFGLREKEELMIPPKALTFIVGATGHCKSTFLINLSLHICTAYPEKKVLYLSYEEALESVYVNMLNTYAQVILGNNNREIIANHTIAGGDVTKLPPLSKMDEEDYRHFLGNVQAVREFAAQEAAFYMLIETGRLNIQYIDFPVDTLASYLKEMRRKGLCDIVFVDYVQLLNAPIRSKYRSREDEMKEICINLKNLAVDKEYGLPIVFGAQFNRQVKSIKDLLPTNIGEAGDIERIANTIVALWNCQKTEDPGSDEERQKIADAQGTLEYNSSAIFAKILKRRDRCSGLKATFPFEGNTGRILDYGDVTTEEINGPTSIQKEIKFEETQTNDEDKYSPF